MSARNKHRFYIDVTFSKPLAMREAAKGAQLVIDQLDLDAKPVWANDTSPYINKITIVEIQDRSHVK